MYLLRMATMEVIVVTYQGSSDLRTITMMTALRIAPLGNSQAFLVARRISASSNKAAKTALTSPGPTTGMPSPGAAMATRIVRMMVSKPLGVAKNFRSAPVLRGMKPTSRFVSL